MMSITFHVQMRPFQEMCVDYYPKFFEQRYNSIFPCGLFVDIPDNKGQYNRWLIVNTANFYDTQFSTFEVLPCDYIFNWVWKGKKIKMAGCLRSQNSYNSGIWADYRTTSVEDQQKFVVPLNDYSEKLFYNQRMIIDTKVDIHSGSEPRAWEISKVNRISPSGLARITLAQDHYDEHKDYIEYLDADNPSTIVGMWADYFVPSQPEPKDPDDSSPTQTIHSEITYAGVSSVIKVGGSYKTFTVTFYENDEVIPHINGHWTYTVDGVDVSNLLTFTTSGVAENQVRFKFADNYDYIDKILLLSYITADGKIESNLEIGIAGL